MATANMFLANSDAAVRQDIFDNDGARLYRLSEDGVNWREVPDGPVNA